MPSGYVEGPELKAKHEKTWHSVQPCGWQRQSLSLDVGRHGTPWPTWL